jgi:RNA polymerase-interacting CarD/CdnL/TRCF family regulator
MAWHGMAWHGMAWHGMHATAVLAAALETRQGCIWNAKFSQCGMAQVAASRTVELLQVVLQGRARDEHTARAAQRQQRGDRLVAAGRLQAVALVAHQQLCRACMHGISNTEK